MPYSQQSAPHTISADNTLPAGTILNNSYTIRQPLGRGGFGITYLADEKISGRLVVIKENFPSFCATRDSQTLHIRAGSDKQLAEYEWALESFENEARILTQLSHPNIVQILTIFSAYGTAYYVMPYINGTALLNAAPAPDEITEEWLRPILLDMLGALAYLHSNELLHRDIKPNNILVTADGTPILIDFGTARTTQGNQTHTQVGTEGYAPLEQWAKGSKRGPWTDLYALGATCYRLITGTEPPDCHDRLEDDPYTPLSSNSRLRTRFSVTLLGSIDKALNMSRHERWQTAGEWLAHLTDNRAFTYFEAKGQPSPPSTTGKSRRAAGRKQKNRKNRLSIPLLLAALAIPAAYLGYQQLTPRQQTNKPNTKLVPPPQPEPAVPAPDTAPAPDVDTHTDEATPSVENTDNSQPTQEPQQEIDISEKDHTEKTVLDNTIIHKGEERETLLQEKTPQEESESADTEQEHEVETIQEAPKAVVQESSVKVRVKATVKATPANTNDDSEIMKAVKSGDSEKLKQLIDDGADIHTADTKTGDTLLHVAAANGDSACVKVLLSAGASVSAVNKKWRTPLTRAFDGGHFSQVSELKEAHIREMKRMKLPTNAKHFPKAVMSAASKGEAIKICMLYALEPNMKLLVTKQGTAYHKAVAKSSPECLLALQAYAPGTRCDSMSSNTPDSKGRTPLLLALDLRHLECAETIIEFTKPFVNVSDNKGRTPLSVATEKRYTEITNKLRAAGAR